MVLATPILVTPSSAASWNTLSRPSAPRPADRVARVQAEAAREVHDAGDLVTVADVPQRALVDHVRPLDEHPGAFVARDQLARAGCAALDEDAGFPLVEQRPRDVRADEPETAGNQDHLSQPL